MDPVLLTSIIGFSGLFVERLFHYLGKTKKSHFKSTCCGASMEYDKEQEIPEKKS